MPTTGKKATQKSAKSFQSFSDFEREAMKERAQKLMADKSVWPTALALKELTDKEETKIAALVKKAALS